MKNTLKNYTNNQQARIITALLLSGFLSIGSTFSVIQSARATPRQSFSETTNQVLKENIKTNSLPRPVANAILRDLSNKEPIQVRNLEIINYSQRIWRNGCLDLPNPDELCTQALVPGWRVVLSNGSQTWIYHTNNNGRFVRLANPYIMTSVPKNFPNYIENAIVQIASQRLNLPTSELTIIQAQQRTWDNGCLNLPKPDESCTQVLEQGWRVVVKATNQILVYHTNATGSKIRLNEKEGQFSEGRLPARVRDAVLQAASQFTGLATSQLSITDTDQITTDGCLNLPRPREACTEIALQAWRVTVAAGKQRLIFHAHPNGREVRLNETASRLTLPQSVANAVLQRASEESGLPQRSLSVVESKTQWNNGFGWQVTVGAGLNRWVFLTDNKGSRIQLSRQYSETPNVDLPRDITERILVRASNRSQVPISQLRIVEVERRQWSDSCLGIANPLALCAAVVVPGWEVTVSAGEQRLVYRVGESGAVILDEKASSIVDNNRQIQPISISRRELPSALDKGVIFRQISSGGFVGKTYETVLLNDGSLIRVRIGDANDSERSIRRIPLEQVERFQQLLERQGFIFNNMSYPAPRGAADYITYTLTSRDGTVKYNDISQNSLPEDLRLIVNTWNRMSKGYE
jgi:hypothetical protein